MSTNEEIQQKIERYFAMAGTLPPEAESVFMEFKAMLNSGSVRAAQRHGGAWRVNAWVKQGIMLGFRIGALRDVSINGTFRYFDKHTYPLHSFTLDSNVRLVPGGSAVRDGCYVAPGVICMPPMYINAGAYVAEGTLIDSHALVGSCAQIGKRVHLSAAAQIGGVLEPAGALPVIVEDDVFIGGNCGVYEGAIVQSGAVLAAGVILTGSSVIYDIVQEKEIRAVRGEPLVVPERAVLIPGARQLHNSGFARERGLSASAPIIVKYRDEKTDAKTALEQALR